MLANAAPAADHSSRRTKCSQKVGNAKERRHRALRWLRSLCLGSLCLALATTASAQDARKEFQRGLSALQAGDNAQAAEAFEAAYRLEPVGAALLNQGIAYTNLGRPNRAVAALSAYVDKLSEETQAEERARVLAEIDRIRRAHANLRLRLIPETAQVSVDGKAVAPSQGVVLLAPGERRLRVEAPGHTTYETTLHVQPGHFSLDVVLEPAPLATGSAPGQGGPSAAPSTPSGPGSSQPGAPGLPPQPQAAAPSPSPEAQQPTGIPAPELPPALRPRKKQRRPAPKGPCALGETCIGPILSLGLPALIGGGVHLRYDDHIGVSVDVQYLPPFNLEDAEITATVARLRAHYHPFADLFFVSAGLSYLFLRMEATEPNLSITSLETTSSIIGRVEVPLLELGIGLAGRDGFFLGADVAAMIPIGSTEVELESDAEQFPLAQGYIQEAANAYVDSLPFVLQVNLLRIGYLF